MRTVLPLSSRLLHTQIATSSFHQHSVWTNCKPRFVSSMPGASQFPPQEVRAIVNEVTGLLRERGETVSVAETVSSLASLHWNIWLIIGVAIRPRVESYLLPFWAHLERARSIKADWQWASLIFLHSCHWLRNSFTHLSRGLRLVNTFLEKITTLKTC